jgi:EAL domain-containing protein (putative c-di-GMP-specific phosphodiesterase class I)
MSPPEVVSSAEDSGRFVDLDRLVLRRACREMGRLVSDGVMSTSSYVSVNISASTVSSIHFERLVHDSLATSDLAPHQLVIEVTESAIMRDPARAIASLRSLTSQGVRVAIDDFGTGYSSMAYLQRLPLAVMKIDRLFVHNLSTDPASKPILRSIVGLANALGLHSIAEGIETAEQAAAMRRLGCRSGQGYLWSNACSAAELPARLHRIATR